MLYHLGEVLKAEGLREDQVTLVCGMARGADIMAHRLFKHNQMPYREFDASWKDIKTKPCRVKYNKYGSPYNVLAGINRNHNMGDVSDILIAFWNKTSTGTKDMIDYMESLGKTVYIINY